MDTQARIEAAKARLEANRAVLVRAKEAGPPCSECVHYIPHRGPNAELKLVGGGPYCGHLAYSEQVFDHVRGKLTQTVQVPPHLARGEDGLCGFEATLFERRDGVMVTLERNLPDILRYGRNAFYWVGSSTVFGMIGYALLAGH